MKRVKFKNNALIQVLYHSGIGSDDIQRDAMIFKILLENRRVEVTRLIVTDRAQWMDMRPIRKFI